MQSARRVGLSLFLKNSQLIYAPHIEWFMLISVRMYHALITIKTSEVHITKCLSLESLGWSQNIRGNKEKKKKVRWDFSRISPKNKM